MFGDIGNPPGPSLIIYLVNFLLVLGILLLFAYRPILRLMDQRAERIRESLEASERAREEAASSREQRSKSNWSRPAGKRSASWSRLAKRRERFRAEEMERARNEAENFVERARATISSGSAMSLLRKCGPASATSP